MAIIEERVGDIFDSPPNSVLIHACNTKGSWGAGVALAFKKYSPSAFQYQKAHCTAPSEPKKFNKLHQESLVGTSLLIGPGQPQACNDGTNASYNYPDLTAAEKDKPYWIACLFTSHSYGKNVDSPESILDATASAIDHLNKQLEECRERKGKVAEELRLLKDQDKSGALDKDDVPEVEVKIRQREELLSRLEMGDCYSVRINSGMFGVLWEETKAVLEKHKVDMVAVRPPDEENKPAKSRKRKVDDGENKDGKR